MLQFLLDITQVAGSLALVGTVILLGRELRLNNRLARARNTQELVSLSAPFHLGISRDRGLAELRDQGRTSYETMDPIDRSRYRYLLIWYLIFHENVHYQWRQGLLDDHAYKPWASDFTRFIRRNRIERLWPELRELFQDEFVVHVTSLIAGQQSHTPCPAD